MKTKVQCTPSTAAAAGTAAAAAGCLCGSDGVAIAENKFCGVKTDGTGLQMDTATCPTNVLDGKTNPSAACNCGTNAAVPVTTAQWCLVPANSVVGAMKTKVQCTPSTAAAAGTAAAAAGCLCGSDGVAIAENKFCGVKTDGTGLQMDTATCPTNVLDGKTNPSAACNCGTNAAVPVTTAQW